MSEPTLLTAEHDPAACYGSVVRPQCDIDGCTKPATRRGWCGTHYERWRVHGDPLYVALEQHGMYGTPEYEAWRQMIQRCTNPKHISWPNYGGRGITVCEHWKRSFSLFLADMGEKPEPKREYSIERINNDGNYEPGNCRWATAKEQAANKRKVDRCGARHARPAKRPGTTSRFKGVYWHAGKWQAFIWFKGKTRYLGRFEAEEDAARAREEAAARIDSGEEP